MKLKLIQYNGYNIAVNENKEQVKLNTLYYEEDNHIPFYSFTEETLPNQYFLNKVIFADPELNLDVPQLPNWKQWEVEQEAKRQWTYKEYGFEDGYNPKRCIDGAIQEPKYINGFIAGYNHNKAKYTEEDLKNAWELGDSWGSAEDNILPDAIQAQEEFIKSLKKVPKYIVFNDNVEITELIW